MSKKILTVVWVLGASPLYAIKNVHLLAGKKGLEATVGLQKEAIDPEDIKAKNMSVTSLTLGALADLGKIKEIEELGCDKFEDLEELICSTETLRKVLPRAFWKECLQNASKVTLCLDSVSQGYVEIPLDIRRCLARNKRLKALTVDGLYQGGEKLYPEKWPAQVTKLFKDLPGLNEIGLKRLGVDSSLEAQVAFFLNRNLSLRRLEMRQCWIESSARLIQACITLKQLESLTITKCRFPKIFLMLRKLGHFHHLKELNMSCTGLGLQGERALFKVLPFLLRLENLDLSETGVRSMPSLPKGNVLQLFFVSPMSFKKERPLRIENFLLSVMRTLKCLKIENDHVPFTEGVLKACRKLIHLGRLESLSLAKCGLQDLKLFERAGPHPSLTCLDLSDNLFSCDLMKNFHALLASYPRLRELNLEGLHLKGPQALAILSVFQKKGGQKMNLYRNELTAKDEKKVVAAFARSSSLKEVGIGPGEEKGVIEDQSCRKILEVGDFLLEGVSKSPYFEDIYLQAEKGAYKWLSSWRQKLKPFFHFRHRPEAPFELKVLKVGSCKSPRHAKDGMEDLIHQFSNLLIATHRRVEE